MTLAEEGNASALLMINAPEVDASSVDFKGRFNLYSFFVFGKVKGI